MKIKINFFQKIFIFSVFIVIFTVLTGYILNIFFLDDFYVYRKKEKMMEAVEISKSLLNNEEVFKEYVEDLRDKEGIDISVFKKNGMHKMRGRREDMHNNDAPPTGFSVTSISKTNIKLLIYNEVLPDGRILALRTSLSVMSAHKHEMYVFNFITTVTSVLLSMLIGRVFSKQITKNIKKLNRVAGKISILDFSEKADVDSGDEIEELSQSIDKMSANLSLSIENLKAFASNASHELRTPITVISTYAQALINGIVKTDQEKSQYYKAIAKESMDMNELVGNLLTISRLSSPGIKLEMNETNILNILKQIGLVFFLAIVGLRYGGKVVDSIRTSGMHLALVAIAVGVTAMMIGFLVGKYVFKLNWILLSGAVCGGMTSTPGLGAAVDALDSDDPAAGYGATYPFALLTKVILVIVLHKLPM